MASTSIHDILAEGPMIPVVTVDDPGAGVDLAGALLAGGLRVIEVTLRTATAMEAIKRIADEIPDIIVGAGTVFHDHAVDRAAAAGARFAVSPGLDPALVARADLLDFAYLPGVQTAGETMIARRLGLTALKFFPALSGGGVDHLKQLRPVFPDVVFCPTGGLTFDNAGVFLALDNVVCVGGSFAAPAAAVSAGDWPTITTLAKRAAAL